MRKIPDQLYSQIFDLSSRIVNAMESGDVGDEESAQGELHALHQIMLEKGEADPFVAETVADFTESPSEAIALYRSALALCPGFPEEPIHTKQISLAERLMEISKDKEAKILLVEALQIAKQLDDQDAVTEAEQLLEHRSI
ncbi:tetratricopeptide repeat protein [Uliginosibacterium sp. TH139]|uniref:tetratricopeptide repeat protein n=1 Tax=Uliginosibacterium sp. TH139 TaxID=2067453 RepID=UPI000C7AF208|nr:tetratricopeptide repeat protein [Uliginosibacterium sp. TH139]PLK47807.1 hypothetical protein C0V76_15690 [Uliginosibacterium sp. TH139]